MIILSKLCLSSVTLKCSFNEFLINTTKPPEHRPCFETLKAFEKYAGLLNELNTFEGITLFSKNVSTKHTISNCSI